MALPAREAMQIALVARRYYLENRTKSEIADELGLSRFKVARLLEQGREHGVVRIEIDIPAHLDFELSRQLERRYPLERAIVVQSIEDEPVDSEMSLSQLVQTAASVIAETLSAGDVLGVAWGRTLDAVVNALPALPPCDVVQVAGGLPSSELQVNAVDLVRRIAERTGGELFPLYAPLLVGDAAVAAGLRQEPQVAHTLDQFDDVTVALVGIGAWDPPSSSLRQSLDAAEREVLRARGACADVCASVFDADGRPVRPELEQRALALTLEQLRAVRQVIAVAGGSGKAAAVRAATLSGCLSTLVTTADIARALVRWSPH